MLILTLFNGYLFLHLLLLHTLFTIQKYWPLLIHCYCIYSAHAHYISTIIHMSLQTTTRWCPDFVVHPWWFGESSWALNARWNVWLPPGMKRQLTSNIFSLLGGSTTNQRWRSEGPMKWWWPFESSLATPWLLAMNGGKFINITLDVATDWFCLEASVSLPSSKVT